MNCGAKISSGGHRRRGEGQHISDPPAHRMPARLQKPPGSSEQDHDEPTAEMHRENADQGQHRQRDAIAMPQRRGGQHEGRDRHAVGRQVRHRGGTELDIRHRRERRRQRSRGGRHSGGVRRAGPQQEPGQHRGTRRKQPHRRRDRTHGVGGGRGRAGQLAVHRGQRVKHRRVVQRVVGLDVAQLTHMS